MKSRDDFSEQQLRNFHERLTKTATKEERVAIFKEMNAIPQAVGQWFRHMGLPPLGLVGETKPQKKSAGKKEAPTSKTKRKPGRPKGSKSGQKPRSSAVSTTTPSPRGGSGLSTEAKEILIRLMDKLLSD